MMPFMVKKHPEVKAFQDHEGFTAILIYESQYVAPTLVCTVHEIFSKKLSCQLKPFVSDGCTLSPDFNFRKAGVLHDSRYWMGGTAADRRFADYEFRLNIQDHAPRGWRWAWFALSWLYWCGVRVGGVPWLPFPWRWGFGRPGWAWRYDR